uniref:Olfactory receptor, family 70, subfamily A, member 7 n=1 Tax=Astyanax mexicanus TaxID=7994 RepID=A0A3B1IJV8_ASTMX
MDNQTFRFFTLRIEGLKVAPEFTYPAFILLLFMYVFIMILNLGLLVLIFFEKNLHNPMHVLFCNLPLNDVIGPTAVVPTILGYVFKESSERYVGYVECIIQAYVTHFFSTTSHSILMIMAVDRYVAICLTARLSHCTSTIFNPFCDNASLFKLSCEDTSINNIYGLTFTVVLLVSSVGTVLITYLHIVVLCVTSKNKQMQSKAMKTCSTHLAVYVIMFVSGLIIVLLHRFPNLSENRKVASIMLNVVPPFLNPIIYGVQTKEIRLKIVQLFTGRKALM